MVISIEEKRRWMHELGAFAKYSNCRSRKIACIILDDDGMLIAIEHNRTANPVCINHECYKRMLGHDSGPSFHCKAIHAEEGASATAHRVRIRNEPFYRLLKKPFTAIMTCGYPCENCLRELLYAGVEHLVIANNTFYTDKDEAAWKEIYSKHMTSEVVEPKT